jgi:hypothetical protein
MTPLSSGKEPGGRAAGDRDLGKDQHEGQNAPHLFFPPSGSLEGKLAWASCGRQGRMSWVVGLR